VIGRCDSVLCVVGKSRFRSTRADQYAAFIVAAACEDDRDWLANRQRPLGCVELTVTGSGFLPCWGIDLPSLNSKQR
jgi:hypothetical protein